MPNPQTQATTGNVSRSRRSRHPHPAYGGPLLAAAVGMCGLVAACSSVTQGVEAGNTRANTATTAASAPLNSTSVLTPQSSPQPSGRATPGATADIPPSPDNGQTTTLRAALRSIDPSLDTDRATTEAVSVCAALRAGTTQPAITAVVRQQFGETLADGTVIAIQNVITGNFCHS